MFSLFQALTMDHDRAFRRHARCTWAIVANAVDELRTAHQAAGWSGRGSAMGMGNGTTTGWLSRVEPRGERHRARDPQKPVELRLRGREKLIELGVHNFGVPIPCEQLPTLFASYRQPSRATTSKGLGLGLYIADQIVRARWCDPRQLVRGRRHDVHAHIHALTHEPGLSLALMTHVRSPRTR